MHRTHAIPPAIGEDRGRCSPQEDFIGFDTIIALDLGKFRSVAAAVMSTATRRHALATLDTTPQRLREPFAAHVGGDDASRTLVVAEACDAAGSVHDPPRLEAAPRPDIA